MLIFLSKEREPRGTDRLHRENINSERLMACWTEHSKIYRQAKLPSKQSCAKTENPYASEFDQ